ncbi:MAG TPA: DUF305 domain-containing protein [Aggregatilinea sp.]|jgi:uncharacterized protein (DUF305 family)|uniref:DUF305 domain-containing protein n=1 Tax=Aggregatilinea sp. TaxID=2806333 RepID=UPI002C887793|nr:DUF305 domain-containing protein [Aggregatilinea sp.]HML24524.1 DUF305 domain-containing protein [Aggregatilinea sp.]
MLRRLLLMFVVVVVPLVAQVAYAQDGVTGRAGRAEVRFMEGMIDHHQMALDMAGHCLEKTTTEAVQTLCQGVIDAQTPEIELMRGWLLDWYGIDYTPVPMAQLMDWMGLGAASGMMDMGHGDHTANPMTDMPLMMGMMSGFDRIEGADYDAAWLEAMIDHHDDAVHMATRVLRYAEHEDLRALAQQIIDDQTAEIELMETILAELAPTR